MKSERCINFRELGGYLTITNKKIKKGKLLRSGAHHQCKEIDKAFLSSLAIDTIIDLRGNKERALETTNLQLFSQNNSNIINHIFWDYDLNFDIKTLIQNAENNPETLIEKVDRLYIDFYSKLPFEFGPRLSKLFDELKLGKTILFHCSAGKDRTGFIAFILLSILEVDYKIIMQDYLLSDACHNRRQIMVPSDNKEIKTEEEMLSSSINPIGKIPEKLSRALAGVKSEYLDKARITIKKEFGSVLEYVKHFTNITDNELGLIRNHYLCELGSIL
ncbi:tyrosine-protein phosphatase [Thorsellia kenyensis]|uniref:Tyrosine-protein phosphatase n=1 Tax=Thorsellia kenyensis TaxID=1549888 RepID=A0ABV6C9B9_9GAMM